jgi:DNA polymerase-3 subunit epsilon
LVKPTCPISEGATAIHGITAADVANAPTFKPVRDLIELMTHNKIVIIYNAGFDDEVLYHCCKVNNLNYLKYESICAMELYSNFIGEMHPYFNNYKWQKLPGGDHTAIGDCKATLSVLESMAATLLEMGQLDLEKETDDIPY